MFKHEFCQMLVEFRETTSIHGLSLIFRFKSLGMRLLMVMIFVGVQAGFIITLIKLVHRNLIDRTVSTEVDIIRQLPLSLPALSFCRSDTLFSPAQLQALNISDQLADFIMRTFSLPDIPPNRYSAEELDDLDEQYRRLLNETSLDARGLIDRLAPSCQSLVLECEIGGKAMTAMKCCQQALRVIFTLSGRCYTTYGSKVKQRRYGTHAGISITLRISDMNSNNSSNSQPTWNWNGTQGSEIPPGGNTGVMGQGGMPFTINALVHNHYTLPNMAVMAASTSLVNGRHLSLALSRWQVDRTHVYYDLFGRGPSCSTVPMEGPAHTPSVTVHVETCTLHYARIRYADQCGCWHLGSDILAGWEGMPVCTPKQVLKCTKLPMLFKRQKKSDFGYFQCGAACSNDIYQSNVIYRDYPQNDTAKLEVYYPEFQYTHSVQHLPNLLDFIFAFGGLAGLWLGMSLLSFIELIVFVFEVVSLCARRMLGGRRGASTVGVVDLPNYDPATLPSIFNLYGQNNTKSTPSKPAVYSTE